MENHPKKSSLNLILIVIAVGIWAIVLQNAGVIPLNQNVYVKGGYIDADVNGSVNVKGGYINADVSGNVSVDNTVSVSIDEVLSENGEKYYYNNN